MQIKPSILGAQRHVNARSTQGEMANAVAQHIAGQQSSADRRVVTNHKTFVTVQNELSQQPTAEPGV